MDQTATKILDFGHAICVASETRARCTTVPREPCSTLSCSSPARPLPATSAPARRAVSATPSLSRTLAVTQRPWSAPACFVVAGVPAPQGASFERRRRGQGCDTVAAAVGVGPPRPRAPARPAPSLVSPTHPPSYSYRVGCANSLRRDPRMESRSRAMSKQRSVSTWGAIPTPCVGGEEDVQSLADRVTVHCSDPRLSWPTRPDRDR